MVAANISALCLSVTTAPLDGFFTPAESVLASRRELLAELYNGLRTLRRATCPFVNLPEERPGRWGLGITSSVMMNGLRSRSPSKVYRVEPATNSFVNPSSLDCELINRLKTSFVKLDEVACQAVNSIG
jgi:hypothetical protein